MNPAPAASLLAYLAQVPDPRGRQGRRHPAAAMLAAIVCALLSGVNNLSAIVQWLHSQDREVWHLLGFTRRPPKDHAFRDLLAAISPEQLERLLTAWILDQTQDSNPLPTDRLDPIALDGKKLRGSLGPHGKMVHLLALFQWRTGLALSQTAVGETNEHKAAVPLIRSVVLKGRVVTGDAMFCQRELCQEIVDHGGHYLFVVKDNQPALEEAIAAEFKAAFSPLY